MKNTVTVRVTLPRKTANALAALARKDSAIEPRPLDNTLAWLGHQAVMLGTINPFVPLAKINEALGNVGDKWRGI